MRRKIKSYGEDEDEMTVTSEQGDNQPLEAFINHDLLNDFIDCYKPGSRYNFTHCFTRPQLRNMFGATIDMNTVDPLYAYIQELANQGFHESISPSGDPCIYVIELDIEMAETVD